jgi:hypothetical protein
MNHYADYEDRNTATGAEWDRQAAEADDRNAADAQIFTDAISRAERAVNLGEEKRRRETLAHYQREANVAADLKAIEQNIDRLQAQRSELRLALMGCKQMFALNPTLSSARMSSEIDRVLEATR